MATQGLTKKIIEVEFVRLLKSFGLSVAYLNLQLDKNVFVFLESRWADHIDMICVYGRHARIVRNIDIFMSLDVFSARFLHPVAEAISEQVVGYKYETWD